MRSCSRSLRSNWVTAILSVAALFSGLSELALAADVDHVIVISIDGGNPTVMNRSAMPTVKSLAAEGAHSWNAQTIVPSITLPSHTSMLTGVGPEVHGVLWNDYIPYKGLVPVPTVFEKAKKSGMKTALFAAKKKFMHLELPGSLDEFEIVESDAKGVARVAARYFETERPNLMFVHFKDADAAGHSTTWGSPIQMAALKTVDEAVAMVKSAVVASVPSGRFVLIVTADHGGKGFSHSDNIPENRTIPWMAWGQAAKSKHAIKSPINTMDTAATALYLLKVAVPSDWAGRPVLEAFQ